MASKIAMVAGLFFAAAALTHADQPSIKVVHEVVGQRGGLYTGNRAPLLGSPLLKLPIGSITPRGWLRRQLELEAQGMVGHMTELSDCLVFKRNAWVDPKVSDGSCGERPPYWLKGYGDLGYVLKDEKIIAAARKWIDAVLASQQPDGYFGPCIDKTGLEGKPDIWPHMLMLNVLQSFHEYTGDARVLPLLLRYHQWLNAQPPETFGLGFWPKMRFGDNLETVYWLYNRTGQPWLLDLAKKIHGNMARWDVDVACGHNVNIAEGFREPAEYYMQAKDVRLLQAVERNYQKVMGRYGQFPGGGFDGDENIMEGHVDPQGGIETCGVVEFMHSFEMLTKISGNPLWADRCEDITFNTFPATSTPDLKGLHYITSANQVQLDRNNKQPGVENYGTMFAYSARLYGCCQHNVAMGWPYYAEELWLATADNGLCASLYAASEVSAKVGNGTTVGITETTDYPFSEKIGLKLTLSAPTSFPLYLRIPRWCVNPVIEVNGERLAFTGQPPCYAVISREWRDGDGVTLRLPMQLRVRRWPLNGNAASVDYGPLSFSLKIGEEWKPNDKWKPGGDKWPMWEVFPTTAWNYGLVLPAENPAAALILNRKPGPLAPQPFTPESAPIQVMAKARRIPAWQQEATGIVGKLQRSPVKSDEPLETVTLIPMGCTRLRITMFPVIGSGPDATSWKPDPTAWPTQVHIYHSHIAEGEITDGLKGKVAPKNSHDQEISRMHWFSPTGAVEWVEYRFPTATKLAASEVYWYVDTGSIRVPQSWRLLYSSKDQELKPVEATGPYGVKTDTFNRVEFKPVEATTLRLEFQLQRGYGAGLLKWKVSDKASGRQ